MRKLFMSLLLLVAVSAGAAENPVLTIEGGKVQGILADDHPEVFVYRGIPYAAPPIKENRWKAPQPIVPWKGVKVCDTFGRPSYQAIQYTGGYYTEWGYGKEAAFSEDCLYLNVWTKAPGDVNKKLPVALWIHGGGYREGFGSEPEFDGQEWGAKDVVLVSINYRLGVFGFLTHPALAAESPNHVSGNYGILDQIEALKWIKKNIAQFGGDPNNVTIFGQSAGGGSVRTLCESPLARGLFHKAVIMSAQGLSIPDANGNMMGGRYSGGTVQEAEANAKKVFDWAGLTDLQKMRAASTETIFALPTLYYQVNNDGQQQAGGFPFMRGLPFMPMIDGYVSEKSFDDATRQGTLADVPYMIGFTLDDMGNMAPNIAEFCKVREQKGGKAWAYQFARPLPDDGSHPEVTQRLKGAFHSSDLWFVFKSLKHCWRPWTKGDWDLSEKMLTAWTNFVKYSDPNGPKGGVWTPCTAKSTKFMVFKLDEKDAEASFLGQPEKSKLPAFSFGPMPARPSATAK